MLLLTPCVVCSTPELEPHFRVAARPGDSDFAPNTREFGVALSDVGRCSRCGHMQLVQMPSDVVLGEVYGDAADVEYVDEEAGQRATALGVLERLERHRRPGRLLDLGCWVGFLLSEADRRGWRTTGVEPSAWASAYAREQLGLDVLTDELLSAPLPDGAFDAVVMGDVIEHLPEPSEALTRIARLLAPGGVLVMTLPDAGSRLARFMGRRWWSVLPTHVQYFTRASLTALLERHGWRVVELDTAPKTFSVGYYLSRLGGYSALLERVLLAAARLLRVRGRMWTPDFRDRMLVVAIRDAA